MPGRELRIDMKAEHGAHAGHGALRGSGGAPPGNVSSAGWKMNRTRPSSSSTCDSTLAIPKAIAVWTSCPHACITPGSTRGEGQAGPLLDGESVQIGPKCHRLGPGEPTSATKPVLPDHRGPDARRAKRLGDQISRVELLVAQFGMTMELAQQRNRLGYDGGGKGLETIR